MVIFEKMKPFEIRELIRKEELCTQTTGIALDYAEANLVILPKNDALEFLIFTHRNPKICTILDITDPGDPEPKYVAPGADIRTDVPLYRVFRDGKLIDEPKNIKGYWKEDLTGFLIGCSHTFDNALINAGIPVRHVEDNHNVPMYITNINCVPVGKFSGPLVVTMRPIPSNQVIKAIETTSRYSAHHGAPVYFGEPSKIGIKDINKPDYGEASSIKPNEVPVFWACGVTPQAIAIKSSIPFMITHAPGYMFITDISSSI